MVDEIIAAKRLKLESDVSSIPNKSWTIKAILSDEYSKPLKRCSVYVGTINDIKFISKAMRELCQQMPLKDLNHLKRVNKSKLILCSLHEMVKYLRENSELETMQEILSTFGSQNLSPTEEDLQKASAITTATVIKHFLESCNLSTELVTILSEKLEIISVAAFPPVLSWQYADVTKEWPCKFHPNKDLERLYNGNWFSNDETIYHTKIMEICEFLCNKLRKEVSGIAVDPRTKSIVAVGFTEIERHPLMHCAMVLIDAVARSQNGGAWNDYLKENNDGIDAVYTVSPENSVDYTLSGVSPSIRKLIQSTFPDVAFGAERVKSVDENRQNYMNMDENSDNLAKYGPYLCTGYVVYLWKEPCIMCSMALTHSRIRTIFFHEKRPTGAICSLTKLQTIKPLNHHFQVFHITDSKHSLE